MNLSIDDIVADAIEKGKTFTKVAESQDAVGEVDKLASHIESLCSLSMEGAEEEADKFFAEESEKVAKMKDSRVFLEALHSIVGG